METATSEAAGLACSHFNRRSATAAAAACCLALQVEKGAKAKQSRKAKQQGGAGGAAADSGPGGDAPRQWNDYQVHFEFPEPTELAPPLLQLIDARWASRLRERGGGGGRGFETSWGEAVVPACLAAGLACQHTTLHLSLHLIRCVWCRRLLFTSPPHFSTHPTCPALPACLSHQQLQVPWPRRLWHEEHEHRHRHGQPRGHRGTQRSRSVPCWRGCSARRCAAPRRAAPPLTPAGCSGMRGSLRLHSTAPLPTHTALCCFPPTLH